MAEKPPTAASDGLAGNAIVFSPHPDDETLACGGTIIKKLASGAEVSLVFLTDGSRSHAGLLGPDECGPIRRAEAFAAAAALGVPSDRVSFLGFEDRALLRQRQAAAGVIADLLGSARPDEVYIPYRHEPPADHQAANWIVRSAVRRCRLKTTICEYPVWFWCAWPWVGLPDGRRAALRHIAEAPVRLCRRAIELRWSIHVADVLAQKRAALELYASQMTRLNGSCLWPVLADVADGRFLERFFRPYELFHRYRTR